MSLENVMFVFVHLWILGAALKRIGDHLGGLAAGVLEPISKTPPLPVRAV